MGRVTSTTRNWAKPLIVAGFATAVLAVAPASATTVLTFEGLQQFEDTLNFYNGGTGDLGSSGTNYGVAFSTGALAVIAQNASGAGNFTAEPSPSTAMFFLDSPPVMNVATGFSGTLTLYYSAINDPGSITLYDGLDGTGTVLASLSLALTSSTSGLFDPFAFVSVPFSGTAHSAIFGGTPNQIVFDNISLDVIVPPIQDVPEPASFALLGVGLLGIQMLRRQSRHGH